MKTLLAAAALLALAAPAHAQWQGGAAQQAAAAYCSSRAAGNNHAKAERDARWMLTNSLNGGFADMMSTALTSGRQMMQTTGYLARQMCPEYFASAAPSVALPSYVGGSAKQVSAETCAANPTLAATMWKERCN